MQLQALLDDVAHDLVIEGASVTIDGREVDLRVHRLDEHTLHLLIDGRSHVVTAVSTDERTVRTTLRGGTRQVRLKTERDLLLERLGMGREPEIGAQELRAPMPGLVLEVLVEPGQEVQPGQGLVVLEAMKMENQLRAELPGRVAEIHVEPGAAVTKDELLVTFRE